MMLSMIPLSLIWMILQKILLGTERIVTRHQFVHCALSPFLGSLKWYYDENHNFPIQAILKHKQVDFMSRKMLCTIFKYPFRSRDIQVFKICKLVK